jgi:outer membrane protein assembly factor BamE (lipoprotein component of BamABCDE complex)
MAPGKGRGKGSKLKILVVVAFLAAAAFALDRYLLDGLVDSTHALFVREDTRYAPGYTDAAFRRVKIGMTQKQVSDLLGTPFARLPFSGGQTTWWFSRNSEVYGSRERAIVFRNGVVAEKLHHFHFQRPIAR